VQGQGSGVAYKDAPDGGTYIITNNHVVESADEIVVTDSTGEQYPGELVGADSETDIAVVKVDAEIPTIEIGDSEDLVVGQLAVAIGSPFGLEGTVTSGIVSALHRPLTGVSGDGSEYPYVDSIQTDAAINPGNSGGALIDRNGQLIGIPSAIMTETGTSEGVGLAIPVNTAVNAADQLIEQGRVDTPFLGILGQTVDETLAKEESLPVDEGAYVAEVTPDTEAEKAGLESGDVIVALDDVRIRTMDDLVLAVRRKAVGDTVTLTLWRDGEKIEVDMKVGVKPQDVGAG
jgi:S1-C subfamily serine protease